MRVREWGESAAQPNSAWEQARSVKYDVEYLDTKGLAAKEEEARLTLDEDVKLSYSAVALLASGSGVVNEESRSLMLRSLTCSRNRMERH